MKNLLINYLSGGKIFESTDLEIYFDSLKKINNADKLVVANNISDKNIKLLEKKYDKIKNTMTKSLLVCLILLFGLTVYTSAFIAAIISVVIRSRACVQVSSTWL